MQNTGKFETGGTDFKIYSNYYNFQRTGFLVSPFFFFVIAALDCLIADFFLQPHPVI